VPAAGSDDYRVIHASAVERVETRPRAVRLSAAGLAAVPAVVTPRTRRLG
jgi:hypothetical protein